MPKMIEDMVKGLKKKGKKDDSAWAIAVSAYEKKTGKKFHPKDRKKKVKK